MKVIQHTAETLRTALVSNSGDLTNIYSKYTVEERRLLEEGFHSGQPGSLFQPITLHSDSDWISSHPEEPQDFESFYRDPYRRTPDARHNTIYIQTIGSFGEVGALTDQYVEWLRDYCQAFFYGLSVKLLPAVTVSETRCSFRVNSNSHNLQILTGDLLRFLGKRKPKDAFCIVGITMIDLYPEDSWNFVFGQASLSQGMGVFSFARYDDNFYTRSYAGRLKKTLQPRRGDYSVFEGYYTPPITSTLLLRSCKTMTHEIGHMFGIKHCQWLNCVMQGSNHLEESDRRPLDFCPVCLRKIHVSVGFKIAERYKFTVMKEIAHPFATDTPNSVNVVGGLTFTDRPPYTGILTNTPLQQTSYEHFGPYCTGWRRTRVKHQDYRGPLILQHAFLNPPKPSTRPNCGSAGVWTYWKKDEP